MKNIELTNEIPSTMSINANAIWNQEKEIWEVSVFEISTSHNYKGEPLYSQRIENFEIKECDEFVLPCAILVMNGLNSKLLIDCII